MALRRKIGTGTHAGTKCRSAKLNRNWCHSDEKGVKYTSFDVFYSDADVFYTSLGVFYSDADVFYTSLGIFYSDADVFYRDADVSNCA